VILTGSFVLQQNVTIAPAAAARPAPRLPRKAPAKPPPPPEHVIEISSGSDENRLQSESSASSARKVSRKEVINTLTFVLSARSKVS
jgi:G2/mitotic-specific cyclin-B, other